MGFNSAFEGLILVLLGSKGEDKIFRTEWWQALISSYTQSSFASVAQQYLKFPDFSKNMLATLSCPFVIYYRNTFKIYALSVEKPFTKSVDYVTENTTVKKTKFLRGNSELRKK
jgi:hypothetical protein